MACITIEKYPSGYVKIKLNRFTINACQKDICGVLGHMLEYHSIHHYSNCPICNKKEIHRSKKSVMDIVLKATAKTTKQTQKEKLMFEAEAVTLVAKSYEWICPDCETANIVDVAPSEFEWVVCTGCHVSFQVGYVDHNFK